MAQSETSLANVLLRVALIAGLVLLLAGAGPDGGDPAGMRTPLQHWLELGVGYLAIATESIAAIVIGAGVARAAVSLAGGLGAAAGSPDQVRLALGRMLAVGLELTIASDILRTAVAPTQAEILKLGAVVLLRTLLNHFLSAEVREQEERARE